MTKRKLPAFMVALGVGRNRKMRRLTDAEFRCFIGGVLDVAAESPERGYLLLADGERATPADVAHAAGVTEEVAAATLAKLRSLGTLLPSERGERLKNWARYNPAPRKSDTPEEWRKRKQKSRANAKTRRVQSEEEGRAPQLTLGHGGSPLKRTRRRRGKPESIPSIDWGAWAREHVPDLPENRAVSAAQILAGARHEPTAEMVRARVLGQFPDLREEAS